MTLEESGWASSDDEYRHIYDCWTILARQTVGKLCFNGMKQMTVNNSIEGADSHAARSPLRLSYEMYSSYLVRVSWLGRGDK